MAWTPPAPAVNGTTIYDATRDATFVSAINDLYGLIAGISSGGGKPPFVVVASNDAPAAVKATADYVCTGVADQVKIQSAIDAAAPLASRNSLMPAAAAQRGRVLLSGGRFVISAPIQMRTAVWLQGCGPGTELFCSNNTGTAAIKLAAPTDHLVWVTDLQINGNGSAGGTCNGIDFDMTGGTDTTSYPGTNPDSYDHITHVLVFGFTGGTRTGIHIWAGSTANNRGTSIEGCMVRSASGDGYAISSASDFRITNCDAGTITGSGYNVGGGNTLIGDCKAFYCETWGFNFSSGRAIVDNLIAQDNANGVLVDSADGTFTNLAVDTCSGTGLQISAANVSVTGFNVYLRAGGRYSSQSKGLYIDGSYADNVIIGSVDAGSITTPTSGTPGARNFVRVPNGSTIVTAG